MFLNLRMRSPIFLFTTRQISKTSRFDFVHKRLHFVVLRQFLYFRENKFPKTKVPTLNWIGKEKIINHHHDVPFRILEHKYGFTEKGEQPEPTKSGNKIIHGDNLEALKALLPEYEGK